MFYMSSNKHKIYIPLNTKLTHSQTMVQPRRPVRIANISGCTGDGPLALRRAVREGPVDVITADYLAEANNAWLAFEKLQDPKKGYEPGFLRQLDRETAHIIAKNGIKVVHDGGALNPESMARETRELLHSYGVTGLKIAYVDGDNVMGMLDQLQAPERAAKHLDVEGRTLSDIDKPVLSANAYVGMGGIVAALKLGADIVISGRCCDASPVMGAAAWWHDWSETDYDRLAGALIAGHVIECGCYATGGNFSGFKHIPNNYDQGFPVAEIANDGTFDILLQDGARGLVSKDTVTAQLVYEIQGPFYLNPDVVADLREIKIKESGKNRVTVSGMTGSPPPPTTKLAICTLAGYQLEIYLFASGLDIPEKLASLRRQLDEIIENKADYTVLRVDQYGVPQHDAPTEALATCTFRVFAQADRAETLATLPRTIGGYTVLGGYCGMHMCLDVRMLQPRPYVNYEPFLIPYTDVSLRVTVDSQPPMIARPPPKTQPFAGQISSDSREPHRTLEHGPTTRAHMGTRVHARSGDKGSNANVGFWVLEDDEYEWLRSFLSVSRLRLLLGDEDRGDRRWEVERFEIPGLRCVHFRVIGILDGGISSTWRQDGLAKSFGEFLRARVVDMPTKFLERGIISGGRVAELPLPSLSRL
ncbi:uncharacterized protein PgNI_00424 [Pyricularia grisea]|uniref:DUF1446-domain-containing protein n=1 Tax=Pyricularia grisea TaxID=148305 RepID=A0A6P8BKN3_PYRGI|nr:uncharacterized protein PgNI_00424 [Pyricularia grisea]TLD17225.1 hypothetical protein PgNI_00424 [Pyricularia grisea]